MGFVELMQERGLLAQLTHEEELKNHLLSGRRTGYIGFDPTAPSLHVGHLLQVLTLRRWQQCGHRVIVVVGGGTALVADPTGKTELRPMLTLADVERNRVSIQAQISKLIDFSDDDQAMMLNNADWLQPLHYVELLREVGAHFSVNRMLTAECFKQRWDKGLSFLEFNYMIMQSYDFLYLFRNYACTVQMGGDDQWSNILSGMELVRRLGQAQAFALTTKLLETSDGKKMGKTEKGAVWLDPQLTSPYDYFQFWRNVEDKVVPSCLAFFTELPMSEVKRLSALQGSEINTAKVELAWATTAMLHGAEEADKAKAAALSLFSGSQDSGADAPLCSISRESFVGDLPICDLLVAAGVVPSKTEARRLIQQGGLLLEGEKVQNINDLVAREKMDREGGVLLRKGKKHWYRLKFS